MWPRSWCSPLLRLRRLRDDFNNLSFANIPAIKRLPPVTPDAL
jgi:hypothetical protein